jgi:hypothetical protein
VASKCRFKGKPGDGGANPTEAAILPSSPFTIEAFAACQWRQRGIRHLVDMASPRHSHTQYEVLRSTQSTTNRW